jgi:hypothetical protein
MVPRGLELNEDFLSKLRWNFSVAVFERVVSEAKADYRLQNVHVENVLRASRKALQHYARKLGVDDFWDKVFSDLEVSTSERQVLQDEFAANGKLVNNVCRQVIDVAKEEYVYNTRVSSESENQPKPVDSIVDDFAVEAQNIANSLALSAAFSAGALVFRLVNQSSANLASAIFSGLSIVIAFATMTNVSRYKIRNEETRLALAEKFPNIKKAVFVLLDKATRDDFNTDLNPFVVSLELKVSEFRKVSRYYGYKEPGEFNAAYSTLKEQINSIEEIELFRRQLVTMHIAGTYYVNSYVQEALVDVYSSVTDMLQLFNQPLNRSVDADAAKDLYRRLDAFELKLEKSLQRGAVRWGFIKQRRFVHWDIVVTVRFFYGLLWLPRWSGLPLSPVENDILGVLRYAKSVSKNHQNTFLRREVRDLATLYWATRESDIASMILVSVFLTFVTSTVFTFSRILSLNTLNRYAFYASTTSALGAILAAFHFVRKSKLLAGLLSGLASKAGTVSVAQRKFINQIIYVTATQLLLTIVRLAMALATAVALPFAIAERGFGDLIMSSSSLPFWIALGALLAAVAATGLFVVVEYVVRYNLTTDIGPFVCELFRAEIESIYSAVRIPYNDIATKHVQERVNWEYTAREFLHRYRFDAVFAADRYGQILQYIQGGMVPCDQSQHRLKSRRSLDDPV